LQNANFLGFWSTVTVVANTNLFDFWSNFIANSNLSVWQNFHCNREFMRDFVKFHCQHEFIVFSVNFDCKSEFVRFLVNFHRQREFVRFLYEFIRFSVKFHRNREFIQFWSIFIAISNLDGFSRGIVAILVKFDCNGTKKDKRMRYRTREKVGLEAQPHQATASSAPRRLVLEPR
jgi:hypothetical protein